MKRTKTALLVGTRKGAFIYASDATRRSWKVEGPHFLGQVVYHMVQDPRDPKVILMAAKPGHLGPTVFRSADGGRTWKEAKRPPAFRKGDRLKRSVSHVFWLTPGLSSQPGVWYAGTCPQGLFRSEDGGATWEGIDGFNNHAMWAKWTWWTGSLLNGTPDGPILHSIIIDPRDARHLYVGLSGGGVFESRDEGRAWKPLNKGVAAPIPLQDPEYGHDPHCVVLHPMMPDRLYQQNHCGIYRLDRPGETWERIGNNMPKAIGDIGFPIVVHPRDADTAWVFPFDGREVWPRVSVDGKPAVYRTRDAGRTWERQDRGLPREQAWFTVKRQAMAADQGEPVGLYFGTTSGEIWHSRDEGARWSCLAAHLPHIYSLETAVR